MPRGSTGARPPPIRIELFDGYKSVRGPLEEARFSERRDVMRVVFLLIALGVVGTLVLIALLSG